MIYIISKARVKLMDRALPAAVATGLPVILMVEPREYDEYQEAIDRLGLGEDVDLYQHTRDNMGVVGARRAAVRLAARMDDEVMLMCDDDLVLPPNAKKLVKWLRKNNHAPGIAAWFPIYQHFLNILPETGRHRHNGSMGRRAFACRPEQLLELGCFQTRMPTNDDTDMVLRLYRAGYLPWWIHSDVVATSLANRYGPGGISSVPGSKEEKERGAYEALSKEFGEELFSWVKTGSMRVNWKKVYEKYAPGIEYTTLRRKS